MKVARPFSFLMYAVSLGGAAVLLAGCPSASSTSNSTTPAGGSTPSGSTTGGSTTGTSTTASTGDGKTVSIVSPHTAEIQNEFEQLWKAKNPGVAINWRDFGGTSDDLNFVRTQFKNSTKEKGIGVDLFFGGGSETFTDLQKGGFLAKLPSDYGVPTTLGASPLRDKNGTWVAAALSNFGILYNKSIATRDKLPIPQTWLDLTNPKLKGRIELADPRHSGSAHTIYEIILQTNGWDKGWKILTAMAGNSEKWVANSGIPLQDVQNGDAVFATAIDFYAYKAVADAGGDKLAYIEPKGQTLFTADPIALMAGAPNPDMAKKFMALVMSPEGQKLWFYAKGTPGGPTEHDLYRLPALPDAYKGAPKNVLRTVDPYNQKSSLAYDSDKASARRNALDDLIGVTLVDDHDAVKAAWAKNPSLDATGFVPMSEADFMKVATKWDDTSVANAQKQKWSDAARSKFGG